MSDEKRGARLTAAIKAGCPGKGLLTARNAVCAAAGLVIAGAVAWAVIRLAGRRDS